MSRRSYNFLLFDCDGVILDSNPVKTEAFRKAALKYGPEAADAMVSYHVQKGGVSRYKKFEFLFTQILDRKEWQKDYDKTLEEYAGYVRAGLLICPEIPGVQRFLEGIKKEIPETPLFVVSGSDEEELCGILRKRQLACYFEGIFGSPAPKEEIVPRILATITGRQGLYFGDSRIDYEMALKFRIPFVMIHGHTEWKDWRKTVPPETPSAPDFRSFSLPPP